MRRGLRGICESPPHVFLFLEIWRLKSDATISLRPGIQPKLQALRALYQGKKIIVGRDKLDVVKGVLQKVSGISSSSPIHSSGNFINY